jgi:metallo-beta-lactamase family protein
MLMDSGYIQEQDVAYLNKQRQRKGEAPVEPLYTQEDVRSTLRHFISTDFSRTFSVANGVEVTFFPAGHILGAAHVQLDIQEAEHRAALAVGFPAATSAAAPARSCCRPNRCATPTW